MFDRRENRRKKINELKIQKIRSNSLPIFSQQANEIFKPDHINRKIEQKFFKKEKKNKADRTFEDVLGVSRLSSLVAISLSRSPLSEIRIRFDSFSDTQSLKLKMGAQVIIVKSLAKAFV